MKIKTDHIQIGTKLPSFIIAEAGVNHNGSLETAFQLIDAAKECGADAIKFQTFKAEELLTKDAQKAPYQMEDNAEESQFEMLRKLEFSADDFQKLFTYAQKKGILFLSSPFDEKSVDLLIDLDVPLFKVGSGEITNLPLLEYIAKTKKPVIISTGMSTLGEVEEALKTIETYHDQIMVMHCVTSYPSKIEDSNLKVIDTLACAFKKPIGFSDHTPGIEMSVAAVARGSCIIEKHFTLDKNLPGPDHKASLEPEEFKTMVQYIRNVELGLGNGLKTLTPQEKELKKLVRKSIVVSKDLTEGTVLSRDILALKRPGHGIEPQYLSQIIGRKLKVDIKKDTLLTWDQLQ